MQTLEEIYRVAFEDNLRIDAQQSQSRLSGCVDAEFNYSGQGDSFTFDYVGESDPEEMVDRFGDLPEGDIDERRRAGHFKPYDDGKRLGAKYDQARQVSDPTNKKVIAMRRGLSRLHDKRILEACVGTAYAGRQGLTPKALPASQKIAVDRHAYFGGSGNAGLTASKVMEAKNMFDKAEHEGPRFMIANSDQISSLLSDDKLASGDYNTVKALVRGEIDMWHGFTFIRYEGMGIYSGGTHQRAVAVVKEAVQYRSRILHAPDAWLRRDKKPHWYGYYQIDTAGCRGEDTGVIEIACAAPS